MTVVAGAKSTAAQWGDPCDMKPRSISQVFVAHVDKLT